MTNYTELKRLAEAAESFKPTNRDLINPNYMAKAKAAHIAFADKAPPDVVLSMIDEIDRLTAELGDLPEAQADMLHTIKELQASLAWITEYIRAAPPELEEAKKWLLVMDNASAGASPVEPSQAQPPAPSEIAITYMTGYSDCKEWAGATNQAQPEPVNAMLVEDVNSEIVKRYKVEKTKGGFWPYCVKAGDGTMDLFIGSKKQAHHVRQALQSACLDGAFMALTAAQQAQPERAPSDDPLQVVVDWFLQADGEFFCVEIVQRTLRIGYNRAQRLCDIAKERAAHGIKQAMGITPLVPGGLI